MSTTQVLTQKHFPGQTLKNLPVNWLLKIVSFFLFLTSLANLLIFLKLVLHI